jgi:tripartite-type tricarboxylate transporter receptor subunit TctC
MKRRTFLNAAASVATLPLASAWAQQFPSRTVTLLVPYAAGGNADFTARLFAEALSRTLGQSVVVDNKAGGGGAIGATHVVNAKPDGHTLLYCAPSVFSVTPHLVKVSYGISDIRPVCLVTKTPMIIVARKNGRYRSLADLVEAAKKAPGAVQMGYSGLGTPNHLAMLNLEAVAGVRFTGIPYKAQRHVGGPNRRGAGPVHDVQAVHRVR